MSDKAKRCAIYIRVSTEEQHLNGLSLPAQLRALNSYAKNNGYEIVDVYADEGISARKPMKNRKALLRLLEDVKKDKIDMILVTKLDRWFRNIKDYNITEEILDAHNCHWKTIFENYDSSTANGQMVINIMLSVNQAECDRTSERIKAVLDYKRSKGEVTSGRLAGYGYKAKDGHLYKDKDCEDIVDEMFKYYFTCFSKRGTYKHLQEMFGIERIPTYPTYRRMYHSITYAGTVQGIDGACEPYITKNQYKILQSVSDGKEYPKHEPYYFSGLIKCPECGKNLTGFVRKEKRTSGRFYIYKRYRCDQKRKHICKFGGTPSENVVEQYMLDHVGIEAKIIVETAKQKSVMVVSRIPILESELCRLNNMYQKGRITEDYYESQYTKLSEQIDEERSKDIPVESIQRIETTFSGSWKDMYCQLDAAGKRTFWKSILKEIRIDKDTRKVCGFSFL